MTHLMRPIVVGSETSCGCNYVLIFRKIGKKRKFHNFAFKNKSGPYIAEVVSYASCGEVELLCVPQLKQADDIFSVASRFW